MPASEFLPIVPVGDLGGPGQISAQGGRATGIECRSGILLTAYAVGSHHTGTFPAGCGCPAALEKHWLVSLKKGTGRRCVEGGNSPVQGARAMGVSSGEPLGVSPAPALGPSPSRPACGLGARCGFETQPAHSPPSTSLSLLVQVLTTNRCRFLGKQEAVPHMTRQFHPWALPQRAGNGDSDAVSSARVPSSSVRSSQEQPRGPSLING